VSGRVAGLVLSAIPVLAVTAACQQRPTITVSGSVRVRPLDRTPALVYVPSSQAVPGDTAVVDQHRLAFDPTVLLITPGTAVRFLNSDPLLHNVFSPTTVTGRFDLGRYGPDETRTITFMTPGAVLVLCRIHPEMASHILVAPASRWTVTDADGRFRLDSIPADAAELVVWHWRGGSRRVSLVRRKPGPLVVTLP
jgi:plastocyanin